MKISIPCGYHVVVSKKKFDGLPPEGYYPAEALIREAAIKAVTIWAAKANFEDMGKGSIGYGKVADFIITDKNILQIPGMDIPNTKIINTFIDGPDFFKKNIIKTKQF